VPDRTVRPDETVRWEPPSHDLHRPRLPFPDPLSRADQKCSDECRKLALWRSGQFVVANIT